MSWLEAFRPQIEAKIKALLAQKPSRPTSHSTSST